MSDYYHPAGYPPPPGSGQHNYPPRPQAYDAQPGYGQPPQGYAPPPQSQYGYQPANEDQYRRSPRASSMQVGPPGGADYNYQGHERRNSGPYAGSHYRGNDTAYYPPQGHYDDRPSSRGSRRGRDHSQERGEKHGHGAEKAVGATLLGGAVAGWAGHELGHSNGLVTVASALAGAYAGHKLETRHEKDKKKKKERQEGDGLAYGASYDDGRRRSHSRKRSGSRRRSSSSSSSDSDSSRRRRRHHHH